MFTTPTVFVLGAGVSVPFTFPSGKELLRIITGATPLSQDERWDEFRTIHRALLDVLKVQTDRALVSDMTQKLGDSLTPSIDTWLAQHKNFMSVGKEAIAAIICHYESLVRRHPAEPDDWYKWVFHRMISRCRSAEDFVRQPVVFITFNYDRMLEYTLGNAIHNFFGSVAEDFRRKMIEATYDKIIHVHGALSFNGFKDLKSSFGSFDLHGIAHNLGDGKQKLLTATASTVRNLADGIRIIGEAHNNGTVDAKITNALYSSGRIIFLGFGYDERNLQTLQMKERLDDIARFRPSDNNLVQVMGTGVGLRAAQIAEIRSYFNNGIQLGPANLTCVPFCDEFISTI